LLLAIGCITRQSDAINAALRKAEGPLSPSEVLYAAHTIVADLGMATVYPNPKLFVSEGNLQAITLPGERVRYEATDSGHDHHFQCITCRSVFDVHGCSRSMNDIAPRGFKDDYHNVTLYGRCRDCAKSAPRPAR
jgi:Fur family ferric uptake transcriptional regulator